jgi:endonuclease/exonuclease/phosphatase family metal-dependent hydrolase
VPTLVVATYNLWGGGEPWRYTAERGIARGAVPSSPATTLRPSEGVWARRRRLIAGALGRARPDVVGLQEVTDAPPMADHIAADLGGQVAAAGGLALLARHPILRSTYLPLPSPPEAEMRQGALLAEVGTPSGPIEVVSLHVTPRSEPARLAALQELLRRLGGRRPLVVGDFNAPPEGATLRLMADAGWRDAWAGAHPADPGPTMPGHAPVVRIDYVLLPAGVDVLAATRLGEEPDADGFYPSDHLGLAATVRLTRSPDETDEPP